MLIATVFVTFFAISAGTGLLQFVLKAVSKKKTNTNPQFLTFQKVYFFVYYLVIFGDWLNAPYLYKLYSHYGFIEDQIAIIYVCGFASALAFGTASNYIVQTYGRCRIFIIATLAYAVACLMKLSPDYTILIVGRLLSGAATSLLFCAQEQWYINTHVQTHDFPVDWIEITFVRTSKGNCLCAVLAGIIAYLLCEVFAFSPVVPSLLSVPVLLLSAIFAAKNWKENGSKKGFQSVVNSNTPESIVRMEKRKIFKACCQQLRTIFENKNLFQVGCIQALFESVLCLFVFLWTPVLDHHGPPLGIVFASFMVSHLLGGTIYRIIINLNKILSCYMMVGILVSAGGAVLICVLTTHPSKEFPIISFCAFLVFELASGMYFPAMMDIKKELNLDKVECAAVTWFRVPLNLIACTGLIFLHSVDNATGTKNLFACCFVAVITALLIVIRLSRSAKNMRKTTNDNDDEVILMRGFS
uniref:Molybdate-anion transporter n=1 Tax=Phallusia mammillata TaxID=59560 RepID=A0A6F9DK22_9ASCI|nr:molybdate-anion transporter-like [Phallusia mammillata]